MTGLVATPSYGDDGDVDLWRLVSVGDVELEVEVMGTGEPVVVIQTALTADELRPLAEQLAAGGGLQVFHYHRRGYAGSGPARGPSTMAAEADDCLRLMAALGVAPAHVLGASFSAAVALTLASSAPEAVRTLTLLEPPPVGVPSAWSFLATSTRLMEVFRTSGPAVALEDFMTMLAGPHWRAESERDLPGSVAAMERDAVTFFASDVPALRAWTFDEEDAAAVRHPALYVGGGDSALWFTEGRSRMLELLPQAEDATVAGAGHLLASTHPSEVAGILLDFLRRHHSGS